MITIETARGVLGQISRGNCNDNAFLDVYGHAFRAVYSDDEHERADSLAALEWKYPLAVSSGVLEAASGQP